MLRTRSPLTVAIACGGTGGHLFPGLAVAEELRRRDCAVTLLVSPKAVDQQAVQGIDDLTVVTLPAVAFQRGSRLAFFRDSVRAYRELRAAWYRSETAGLKAGATPHAALGMGGFTSVAPLLAARRGGAATFLHEANAIPGRANRLLSRMVDQSFVGFPTAGHRLRGPRALVTGTPVRSVFVAAGRAPQSQTTRRLTLGLHPDRPVALVVGGSQGARGLNDAVRAALPVLAQRAPEMQWIHLTGAHDVETVKAAYAAARLTAIVLPFFDAMDVALGAASVCISRAGASFLAEVTTLRVPAVLVPLPTAADNHQWHNARQLAADGAACLLEQAWATPESLAGAVCGLVNNPAAAAQMRAAQERWQSPRAAADVAEALLRGIAKRQPVNSSLPLSPTDNVPEIHPVLSA